MGLLEIFNQPDHTVLSACVMGETPPSLFLFFSFHVIYDPTAPPRTRSLFCFCKTLKWVNKAVFYSFLCDSKEFRVLNFACSWAACSNLGVRSRSKSISSRQYMMRCLYSFNYRQYACHSYCC